MKPTLLIANAICKQFGGVGLAVAADHKKLRGMLLAKHAAYRLLLLLPIHISGL